jgi:hypothetical protein
VQGNGGLTAAARSGNMVIRFELGDSTADACRTGNPRRSELLARALEAGAALVDAGFPGPMAPPMPNIPMPLRFLGSGGGTTLNWPEGIQYGRDAPPVPRTNVPIREFVMLIAL